MPANPNHCHRRMPPRPLHARAYCYVMRTDIYEGKPVEEGEGDPRVQLLWRSQPWWGAIDVQARQAARAAVSSAALVREREV